MPEWEAPAKLNLDLRIGRVDARGMHPLRSLVQTIQWCDMLTVEPGDEDCLRVTGPVGGEAVPEGDDNLVWKALSALELDSRPRFDVSIGKEVAVAAGLGGGSSDAAAMLLAVADLLEVTDTQVRSAAEKVGADVAYFLSGGSAVLEGYGERVGTLPAFSGFAVAVVVPPFGLSTSEVYRRWDELDSPAGSEMPVRGLPPPLRAEGPFRNDLTDAAVSLRPELADWMGDLAKAWARPIAMSGSGPALFAYFADEDEAGDAVAEVGDARAAVAATLRPRGAAPREI